MGWDEIPALPATSECWGFIPAYLFARSSMTAVTEK